MSIEKNINSRIVHKHDVEANWIKATNFIPKQGEIIIYDIDDNHSYPRFKIGDGLTLVNNLPFGIVQSDQNQNDETAIDFIKNRLAYTIPGKYELISDADVPFVQGEIHGHSLYYTELTPLVGHWIDYNISTGVPMQLTINDKVFNFTTKFHSELSNCVYGGNLGLSWVNELDTGEDFFIQAGLDTPEDTIGFCILCLTDLEPAESYRVSLKVIIKPDTYKQLDTNYYDRLAWTDNKTTTISFNGNISEDKYIHDWNSEVFYYHIYVSPRKIIPKDIIEIERTNISTGEVTKEHTVLKKMQDGSNIIYGVQGSFEFIPYVKIASEPFELFETTYPAGTYFTLFGNGLEDITGYISKATLLLESNIHQIDPIYYERLGWIEDEEILFENISFVLYTSEESNAFIGTLPAPLNLQANNSYLLTINDEEYELIPSLLQIENTSLLALGNPNFLTNDKSYPFLFIPIGSAGFLGYRPDIVIDQNTINVSLKKNKYIHKIHEQYYDRIAGVNKPEEIILQDVTLKANEEIQNLFVTNSLIQLNENAKYLLEIDGKSYNLICKKIIVEDEFDAYYLGNSNYIDIPSNDTEPFVFAFIPNEQLIQLYINDSNASECTISLKALEDITIIDSKFLPLATFNQLGAVAPETKTEVDVQPVTVDEEGRLWTEPTSNTIATDDGDGNVVLISMATQEPENIVTDDGDGNVEVHSTSLYNPFPGIETAAVGQIAQVAEIDENGNPIKWELINIENSSNNNIVIVEIDLNDLTTSASSEEISEMYEAGKMIIGSIGGFMGTIVPDNPTYAYGYLSFVENNQLTYCVVQINSSTVTVSEMEIIDFSTFVSTDTYSTDKTTLINLLNNKITAPIDAAVGQVLSVKTVNTDGVPIEWEAITLSSNETSTIDIPTPTAADAGKFLRVSAEGLYILETLVDVSEVGA